MTNLIVLLVLLGALVLRVPIALALAAAGGIGVLLLDGASVTLSSLGRIPFAQASRSSLVIIPMFILMGVAARHARLAEEAFRLLAWLLRRVPGGLAIGTVIACAGFAAVSGSSIATVVAIGNMAITEMRKHGYSLAVAAGVVGASGTLGVLIPPSVPLVLFGILTRVSIGSLLLAGLLPGLLSAALYGGAIYIRARRNPEEFGGAETVLATIERPALGKSLAGALRITTLFLVVIGGIFTGLFTAVEASAVGAFTAVLMVIAVWRRQPREMLSRLRSTVQEAVSLNSMIFALLIGGGIFSFYTVGAGIPSQFTRWVLGFDLPPLVIVIVLLLALVPLGMFLDPLSIMLIGVPIAFPLVMELGLDGVWFGILFVKFIEVGLITPPLGLNAFVVAGTTKDLTPEIAFKGILAYLPLDLLTIALIFIFPIIVTIVPTLVGG